MDMLISDDEIIICEEVVGLTIWFTTVLNFFLAQWKKNQINKNTTHNSYRRIWQWK